MSVAVSFFACVYQSTVARADERRARVDVEPADEVLLAEVEVDRAVVDRRVRARALDGAEHGARLGVDDGERVELARTEHAPAPPGSPSPPRPSPRRSTSAPAAAGRARAPPGRASRRPRSSIGPSKAAERTWPSSTRGFAWSRMAASTVRASSVSGSRMKYWSSASSLATSTARPRRAPARASPLLPQRGDRAREADRDRAVERADVDPQLERIRGGDAEQLAAHQALLDLAALRSACSRRGTGARRAASAGSSRPDAKRWISSTALRLFAKQIVRWPRGDEAREQARRVAESARADAELGVDQLGVPERDRPLGRRRGVAVDHGRRLAEQRFRQLRGVRDRRRREHELRLRPVRAGEPAQAAEHVRDVRAEDAAVDVRLVDDDVAQVREHVAPAVVVREHADVEHVRVGQDRRSPTCGSASGARSRCPRRRSPA